jgi:PAS domain S-box-containing protein
LAAALEALGDLGVTFPPDLSQYDPSHAMQEAWSILSEKTMDDLLNLPEMTDPLQLARLQILVESGPPAYYSRIELLTPIVLKFVDLTLRYGHTEFSPYVFCGFGLILCGIGGYIEEGYKSAQIGLGLMEHRGTKGVKCKMYHLYNAFVRHFKQHIKKSTERTEEVFQAGLETGDFEYAGWYAYMHCMHLFMAGEKLPALAKEMAVYNAAIRQIHQQTALDMHEPAHQAVLNLMSDCDRPTMLIGDVYDERSRLQPIRKANDRNSMLNFYFNKIMLCYLFENYEEAFEHAEEGIQYLDGSTALLVVPLFHFYDSLVQLAVCNSHSGQDRGRVLKRVADNLKKIGLWATHAPMNHLHKYYLVEAERLRVTREDDDKSLENYNLAIQFAKENGFLHEEALANKMAAKFSLEKGMPELAGSYMGKAIANYATWGAVRICRYLEEKYSELLSVIPTNTTGSVQVPAMGATTLDLSTMLKASQAVSREIELPRLIKTFMTILLENRGAQKGFLILSNQDELEIEATCSVDEGVILFRPPVPVQSGAFLPGPIVRLVAATHETVVIDDARREKRFQTDPYIKGTQPRSVLCLPILQKAALTGIIYLENNLISGAFTPERLEVVRVLASQIAISVDNARLYDNLRKAEEKYRGIFDNAVEGIYQTTPGGRFITTNPAMAQMFGFETPEQLLESVTDIRHQLYVSPERRDEFVALMQRKERVFGFEAEFHRRNGSRFWAALYARPVYDEEGNVVFMEGLVTDITHQKKMMEALQESEEYLRKENIRLRSSVKARFKFGGIVGKSPAMQDVYELILKAAASDANVIIYGESGAGKELVAREIHNLSDRKGGRLVTVNSAAIPENLLESEFFGYKRGAFTGANRDKQGYLDLADGGTLFLDELGELAPSMQAKLLRVIDGGGYTPIGETTIKHSDARIIAATNRDLQDHVKKGIIREDFFFRIHVVPIYLPPLRERREDIPLLIEHFMNSNPRKRVLQPIPASEVHLMQDYNWPGNVRELRNAVERYLTLGTLTFSGLRSALKTDETLFRELPEQAARLKDAAAHFEKCYITRLLEKNQWHRGKVAEILGVDRRTLFRKMKTYEIEMSH